LRLFFKQVRLIASLLVAVSLSLSGCSPKYEARVYNAPKTESEFVKPPPTSQTRRPPPMMGGSSIPLDKRRILGAAIPYESVAYFLKATDTIERLEGVAADFRTVVERFAIDGQKRELKFELPEGWSMKWRDGDIAMAEFNVAMQSGGPIVFTVTELGKPTEQSQWETYLLGNINRWRGQLQLPEIDAPSIQKEIPTIPRQGFSLPGYVFDASGGSSSAGESAPPQAPITEAPQAAPSNPTPSDSPLDLSYAKPESWELQASSFPRLATFKISGESRGGEVVVSMAKDSPNQNASMWCQQVLQVDDDSVIQPLATKTVNEAEEIPAGSRKAKLYSMRASEDAAASSLMVAAIPTGESNLCLFVKLKSDLRTAEEEKSNLLSFVNSLRWE